MVCRNCLETIADDSVFCSKCGAKQNRKIICKNCNAELETTVNFCKVCGTPVKQEKQPMEAKFTATDGNTASASDFDELGLEAVDTEDMPINSREVFAFITENMQLYPFFKIKKTA